MGTESRNITQGVKYELTPELKKHLKDMRKDINLMAEDMAELLEMKLNTYKNLEKATGSNSITTDTLNSIFEIYKNKVGWESMPIDQFVIMHLEKYLYGANAEIENLQNQDWVKAYYMKYQYITLSNALERRILRSIEETDTFTAWVVALKKLNSNKHIKLKTNIKVANEVYVGLDKEKYKDLGDYPYWCIKYELTDKDINCIVNDILTNNKIRYSTLFSLLVCLELEERQRKDYDQIYANLYNELESYGYENIFDKIAKVVENYTDNNFQSNFISQGAPISSGDFYNKLQSLKNGNMPESILKLIDNCTNGKDKFANAINVDFSPLFTATETDIESFRVRLAELLISYLK